MWSEVSYDDTPVDGLLDGVAVVVFEFKSSLLSIPTKTGRDFQRFETEVKLKFIKNQRGSPKGLGQLAYYLMCKCGRRYVKVYLNDRLEGRSEESVKETTAKALGEHLSSHEG